MSGQDNANMLAKEKSAKDLAEEALMIAIKNAALDEDMIKALRLTCKRTKVAAGARVKEFTLRVSQEPEAVQRAGLLNNISKLQIYFNLRPSDGGAPNNSQILSRALGLLNLAVGVCSKSVVVLMVTIDAPPVIAQECGLTLGKSTWESLKELSMAPPYYATMPVLGFIPAFLARSGCMPALSTLHCRNLGATDIEAICNSGFPGNLTSLSIQWSDAFESNVAPATVAAMRILLQLATNLETLHLISNTYDFFDSQNLVCLKSLYLENSTKFLADTDAVDFAPVLARPWQKLEKLEIHEAFFKGPDLVRIFEADDTLTVLKKLSLIKCCFTAVDMLSCVRRPHLEKFHVHRCTGDELLLSKLAQVMMMGTYPQPRLKEFYNHNKCEVDSPIASATQALSDFLRCPCVATLESLTIHAGIGNEGMHLLFDITNHCPKLKHLDLEDNFFGRPAFAMLLGYGEFMGALPELEELSILEQGIMINDINSLDEDHPYMLLPMNMEETLQRVWPDLIQTHGSTRW